MRMILAISKILQIIAHQACYTDINLLKFGKVVHYNTRDGWHQNILEWKSFQ